jgi:uncharacterized LabA/DUF88 family protein
MTRVAVFVDAGYLFAQGSASIAGSKQPRTQLRLDVAQATMKLTELANNKSGGLGLLRIYWYDGASAYKGPTLDHAAIAQTDNIKLRLGFLNNQGEQKGVDSLIVTDLVELARNRSISDAVLLSGDEDVRIGVQIAQTFGVRVHLLGIHPSRGSQSIQLIQESDTCTEWDAATVGTFLTVAPSLVSMRGGVANPATVPGTQSGASAPPASGGDVNTLAHSVAQSVWRSLSSEQIVQMRAGRLPGQGRVPADVDRLLLRAGTTSRGRELTEEERKAIRSEFLAIQRRAGA